MNYALSLPSYPANRLAGEFAVFCEELTNARDALRADEQLIMDELGAVLWLAVTGVVQGFEDAPMPHDVRVYNLEHCIMMTARTMETCAANEATKRLCARVVERIGAMTTLIKELS